ncbi:MAG: T9SS type A sorting domain-containing protein, partial [Chitinophagaceae bacterium]
VNLGASTPGTYTVTYTVAASGGCNATATANITINPQAFVNNIGNQVYCNNMVTTVVPFTGNAPSYSWANTNPGIGLAASGTGTSLPSFTTVNAGPGVQYAYVRVTPQGNGSTTCAGRGFTFRIAVNYCGPVAGHGDTNGDGGTARMQQSFQVGPNPAIGSVVLQYNGTEQGPFTVQLVSQYGTPVGKAAMMSGTTHTLDLSNITPGSYLLKVTHVKTGVTFHKQLIKL